MLDHIPNILVHMTHVSRVKSIMKNGLVVGSPRYSTEGEIRGLYLARENILDCDATAEFSNIKNDMATFYIDVSSIKHLLKPDPSWRSCDNDNPQHFEDDLAWYITQNISKDLIVKIVF